MKIKNIMLKTPSWMLEDIKYRRISRVQSKEDGQICNFICKTTTR
jgi:hypothetical protein